MSLVGDSQARRLRETILKLYPETSRNKDLVQSGLCSEQLKTMIRKEATFLNKLCFVIIAINDILQGISCSVIKQNISTIVAILKTHNKSVIISTLPPVLNQSDNIRDSIKSINIFIQSLHTKDSVTVLFLHRHFPPFNTQMNDYYQLRYHHNRPDNIHLSSQGHNLLINLISAHCQRTTTPLPSAVHKEVQSINSTDGLLS